MFMPIASSRLVYLPLLLVSVLAAAATPLATAADSGNNVVEEHALAQQGFAIPLAANVLESHLYYFLISQHDVDFPNACIQMIEGDLHSGSMRALTLTNQGRNGPIRFSFFYDNACQQRFLTTDYSSSWSPTHLVNKFYGLDGKPNGLLITASIGVFDTADLLASGLGTFIGPSGSGVNAALGLTCKATDSSALCYGGINQDFPSLGLALGSSTPLNLQFGDTSATFATPISGTSPMLRSGALGGLALNYTDASKLALTISGGDLYGTDTVTGQVGAFPAFFPPVPTGWMITDSAHDARFAINVLDNTTRSSVATITTLSTGATRATANLDQSGSGAIHFSDGSQARVVNWVLSDPQSISTTAVNPNQHGLTGSWYNPNTSGQGLEIEIFPNVATQGSGLFFAGWFTYDAPPVGGAEAQRWYSLQGNVSSTSSSSALTIYSSTGGNFDAPPIVPARAVGQATITFTDCSHATLDYSFSDGSGRSDSIALSRLTPNITCAESGDNGMPTSNYLLSGSWYDPSTSGQGMLVDISPSLTTLFAAWYTFSPTGQATGAGASQRWYTIQSSSFGAGMTMQKNIPILATTGGLFDSQVPPVTQEVGMADITFQSCQAMTLDYRFSSGSNASKSGTLHLQRVGPTPAGCTL